MVSLCTCRSAVFPRTSETQIVGTLATDVVVAEMVVESLWVSEGL